MTEAQEQPTASVERHPRSSKNAGVPKRGAHRSPQASPPPTPQYAHPSEREFTRILDFYGIQWSYEPRSFPLRWDNDRLLDMFTPDFYLPDFDLYVELTTLRQSLVTEKNRKLRRMQELYPEIAVKLLYKRDFQRLLAKYGFGPLAEMEVRGIDRILITTQEIRERVAALESEISQDYAGNTKYVAG